jgi:hypothetical protein
MIAKLSLSVGLILAAATIAPVGASAMAPQSPVPAINGAEGTLLHKAQWGYGRCRAWRHECAARWGWRSPRYFRCVARHGC